MLYTLRCDKLVHVVRWYGRSHAQVAKSYVRNYALVVVVILGSDAFEVVMAFWYVFVVKIIHEKRCSCS